MTEPFQDLEAASPRRFRPYPEYKDSSVEWLGEIPQHWAVVRTKFAARLRSGHTPSRQRPEYWENCTIPWFGLADVWQIRDGTNDYVYDTAEKISELGLRHSSARLLPKGTVILSRTASVGFSGILGVDMATTQDFVNWICGAKLRPEYLLLVFRSMRQEFRRLTMGSTHQTIYMPDVGTFSTPIPPLREQDRIIGFLREETAKIDALVAKEERLIELLQENRIAVVTRVVTQGLDPSMPMETSGFDWLRKVPTHWKLRRLSSTVTACQNGVWGSEPDGRNDIICVRVADFDRVRLQVRLEDPTLRSVEGPLASTRRLHCGDLLLEKSGGGDRQPVGAVVIYNHSAPAVCSNFVARMKVADGFNPRYLTYLHHALYSSRINTRSIKQSTGIQNLDSQAYLREVVAIPDLGEQDALAGWLDRETSRLDALVDKVRQAIDRLKELRAALISAGVTGKIDVRAEGEEEAA